MTEFTPCSPKHKSCSPFHADMVRSYTQERQRQEIAHDGLWDAYGSGEYTAWKDQGGQLITFGEWLRAHKRTA
jgi:hypothetical protein